MYLWVWHGLTLHQLIGCWATKSTDANPLICADQACQEVESLGPACSC